MKNERALIITLALIQFTHIMDFMILMPLGPMLLRAFAISPQQFSVLVSTYSICAGVVGLTSVTFADRFDRKKFLTVAYVGFLVGTFACGFAPNYHFFLLARGVAGCFGGVLGALIMSVVGDTIAENRRGQAMGMVMAGFSLAAVAGVPLGLLLANHFGWHMPFFFIGGFGLMVLALIQLFIPTLNSHIAKAKEQGRNIWANYAHVFLNTKHQMAFVFIILLMLSAFSIIPFFSPYMVSNIGFREDQLPLIYLTGGFATIFTSRYIGKLADRHGKLLLFRIFSILTAVIVGVLAHIGRLPIPVVLVLTTIFFIFNNGRFVPAMAFTTTVAAPQVRGSFMLMNSALQSMGTGLASFIAGLIVTKSPSGELQNFVWVCYLAIALAIASVFLSLKIEKK